MSGLSRETQYLLLYLQESNANMKRRIEEMDTRIAAIEQQRAGRLCAICDRLGRLETRVTQIEQAKSPG